MHTTHGEIVDEMSAFELTPEHQHVPGEEMDESEKKSVMVSFGQIYLSKPMIAEADGMAVVVPKEARLRNLTIGTAVRGYAENHHHNSK